jgi:hypothetical protein
MRENRTYGSEGGGTETNRFSLPLSGFSSSAARLSESLRRVVIFVMTPLIQSNYSETSPLLTV